MKSLLICSFIPQIMAGLATMLLAAPVIGQDLGSVTHNGVEMKVKAAVAVWHPEDSGKDRLEFLLLPYVPTPAEIQQLQAGKRLVITLKKSPFAAYKLSWDREKGGVGDHNQAWIWVYASGISGEHGNVNLNGVPGKYIGMLKGKVKVGEKVEITVKGKDTYEEDTVSWDLHIHTKVLADTNKKP